ncbi:hypothetical protein [Commensalibacter papalotli (ex Botero et al. 2024)]|uniref:GH15 family (SGA1) (PDB:1AGM) n=1 Tax=Commensalibacter papalotli (ex Botero et al. 2024) TaxID=2972766 RepID=A0ABN8W8K0_9PROT|nr:hypothetical protein [Commensalibacter papalotli (ex Botero et al. 2024)]CAI3934154.1 4-alpha-glucosidase) [Commensalibacter papalotli (ex Botero et al. 2024)]CAI3950231.1 4-alpha-glucosidase) [Commensalibacter papalotli (ex Botero et al. 2024)]
MEYKRILLPCKTLGLLLACSGLIGTVSFAMAKSDQVSSDLVYSKYVQQLQKSSAHSVIMFAGQGDVQPYSLFVHSPSVIPLLKNQYDEVSLNAIIKMTQETRQIAVTKHPWGTFVQAASFASQDMASETNYDAIWLRDSVWGYLALDSQADTRSEAHQVLLTLWDYMATSHQIDRMKSIILNPALVNDKDGQMNVPHIRFNSASAQFEDVQEKGKPQPWTHKQNDALGLFLDTTLQEVKDHKITADEWNKDKRLDALIYLVGYLDKARFDQMEDSGAWEEDARLNTSSVALVTSALENLQKMIAKPSDVEKPFVESLQDRAKTLKLEHFINSENLLRLVDLGYLRIDKQLAMGGESPDYPKTDPRYRQADAALLNLIYPARLHRLTIKQKEQVLDIVAPLMGDIGIRRYFNDNYQSANFWFHNIKTDTDSASHAERKKQFIPGTEAQWFFDSWYAKAALMVYKENKNPHYKALAFRSMNHALAQITGPNMIGANAKPVAAMALPESYNFIADKGELWEAPSPITPLNWAKASMTLMLEEMKADIHK